MFVYALARFALNLTKRMGPCPARAGGTGGTVVEPCRKPVRVKGLCRPKRARVEVRVQKPHTHIYILYNIFACAREGDNRWA